MKSRTFLIISAAAICMCTDTDQPLMTFRFPAVPRNKQISNTFICLPSSITFLLQSKKSLIQFQIPLIAVLTHTTQSCPLSFSVCFFPDIEKKQCKHVLLCQRHYSDTSCLYEHILYMAEHVSSSLPLR